MVCVSKKQNKTQPTLPHQLKAPPLYWIAFDLKFNSKHILCLLNVLHSYKTYLLEIICKKCFFGNFWYLFNNNSLTKGYTTEPLHTGILV